MAKEILWLLCFTMTLVYPQSLMASGRYVVFSNETFDISSLDSIEKEYHIGIGSLIEDVDFNVSTENCKLYQIGNGFCYVKIDGSVPVGGSEEPQIPMNVLSVDLPLGSELCGVKIISGNYKEIKNPLNIVPWPQQKEWRSDHSQLIMFSRKQAVYDSEKYYPGRMISCDGGSDGRKTIAYIRVFPLQYIPKKRKGILLTDATIQVFYRHVARRRQTNKGFNVTNSKNIIICPDTLKGAASHLKGIHAFLGITTEIYTTEEIDTTYQPSDDSHFSGYATIQPYQLCAYNYQLSKKIRAFLADEAQHPDLESVTILGSGLHVPPSYYHNPYSVDDRFYYNNNIASDFLYASPDDDEVPNYQVGRLPARNRSEAELVVNKIQQWCLNMDLDWFRNISIAGGKPFGTEYYFGELITVDAANREYFEGMNITRFFDTDGMFSSAQIEPILRKGGVGFFYQIGHGSGDALYYDDGSHITSIDLMKYDTSTSQLPIVVCVACMNGAFDTDIIAVPEAAQRSFGEAVLLSRAGGIAYIGGSRLTYGTPSFYFNEGNLIVEKEPLTVGLLTNAFATYSEGISRLGELMTGAVNKFLEDNDMTDPMNLRTVFGFTLLGDPALSIPVKKSGVRYRQPVLTATSYDNLSGNEIPMYVDAAERKIVLNAETNSPSVTYTLVNFICDSWGWCGGGTIIDSDILDPSQPFDYEHHGLLGKNLNLFRVVTEDGKEGWLYFTTTDFFLSIDGCNADWEGAGIEPIATDPAGDISVEDFDLHDLYITDDEENWYIGFRANLVSREDVAFGLAIDTKPGGYTGVSGEDVDAFGNYVTFCEDCGVDYELYFRYYFIYEDIDASLFQYCVGWDCRGYAEYFFASYSSENRFVEVAIPKWRLDHVTEMNVILFSSFAKYNLNNGPAIDAVPTDTATYTQVHTGPEYANTLSNFVKVRSHVTSIDAVAGEELTPKRFLLYQNYPNPFNPTTSIRYSVIGDQSPSHVTLKIYNLLGQEVRELVSEAKKQGVHTVVWDGKDNSGREVASGVYFSRLQSGGCIQTKRMMLLR